MPHHRSFALFYRCARGAAEIWESMKWTCRMMRTHAGHIRWIQHLVRRGKCEKPIRRFFKCEKIALHIGEWERTKKHLNGILDMFAMWCGLFVRLMGERVRTLLLLAARAMLDAFYHSWLSILALVIRSCALTPWSVLLDWCVAVHLRSLARSPWLSCVCTPPAASRLCVWAPCGWPFFRSSIAWLCKIDRCFLVTHSTRQSKCRVTVLCRQCQAHQIPLAFLLRRWACVFVRCHMCIPYIERESHLIKAFLPIVSWWLETPNGREQEQANRTVYINTRRPQYWCIRNQMYATINVCILKSQ